MMFTRDCARDYPRSSPRCVAVHVLPVVLKTRRFATDRHRKRLVIKNAPGCFS
jgi:hypothetical protein